MEGYQQFHHLYTGNIDSNAAVSSSSDRLPQWSIEETRNFLMIRAELDPKFMENKRNRPLWDLLSMKMRENGYNKSAEQCKCKWKNLVTRFKGYETIEADGMRLQFPFYNELQAIFAARMQRMVWLEAEGRSNSKKKAVQEISSDEEDNSDGETTKSGLKKKRKIKDNGNPSGSSSSTGKFIIANIREIMEKFMKQQMQIEHQWLKAYEEREEQRRINEMEWRQTMGDLENERIMMDRRWRDREEQRRIREETRAEKMDVLITAILNKLTREAM